MFTKLDKRVFLVSFLGTPARDENKQRKSRLF